MSLLIFIGTLLFGIAIGLPIVFALVTSGVAIMLWIDLFQVQIVAQNMINGSNNFVLMAIPFFLLAGELMNSGGLSKRIVALGLAMVGHLRGGLGYVAIFASLIMASLSGSAVADTAAICGILIPMMREAGYNPNRSTGLISAGGIVAPIIPPSIGFVVFGVAAGVSITQLFMAGIVPGIMMGVGLIIAWSVVSRKDNVVTLPRQPVKVVLRKAVEGFWALLMPIIIIGGLRGGIFTPTEAGVVAAVYAALVGSFIYRELNFERLYEALVASAKTSAAIMFLLAGAMVASWLITITDLQSIVLSIVSPILDNPKLLLFGMVLIVFCVGAFLDFTPTILILTPMLMPVVRAANLDPVYFGVIFMVAAAIGMITPPVGTVLNAAAAAGRVKLEGVIVGVVPFLVAQILMLGCFILFPEMITVPMSWFVP